MIPPKKYRNCSAHKIRKQRIRLFCVFSGLNGNEDQINLSSLKKNPVNCLFRHDKYSNLDFLSERNTRFKRY